MSHLEVSTWTTHGHGWPNRQTWALVCWLHAYWYIYLMDVSLACWNAAETAFVRFDVASGSLSTSGNDKTGRSSFDQRITH